MFAKYDADGDSGLNLSEQGRMQRDLDDQKVIKTLRIIIPAAAADYGLGQNSTLICYGHAGTYDVQQALQ